MIAKFLGTVRGYSVGDDGRVHLAIDEVNNSEAARFYVHDLERSFNPQSGNHGYGAKDVPCSVKPGFASYHFALPADDAKHISHGSRVQVELDIFNVRKVKFYNRRWATIPEIRYELLSIRPEKEPRQGATPEGGNK